MAVQIPFPIPSKGFALNSKLRVNLDFLVDKFNEFNTGTATWDTVAIGTANSLTGTLTFYNNSNANYFTIQAGATSANVTLTMPLDDGDSGEFLQTNGSGVLSWASTTNEGLAGYVTMYNGSTFGAASTDLQAYVTQNSNLIRLAIAAHAGLGSTRTYTVPNAGANAQFILSEGSHSINGNLDILSPNYLASSKIRLVSDTTMEMQLSASGVSGYTIKWPNAQGGAGTVLENDGAGNLTWEAPAGTGTVALGSNGRLAIYDGTGTEVDDQATIGSGVIDITIDTLAANRSYTIPDAGTNTAFVLAAGDQMIAGTKAFTTAGGIYMQAAAAQEFLIDSTNNSLNDCFITTRVGGSGAGDSFHRFTISGVTGWSCGIDNSDSDKFKISQSASLGTNDYLSVTTAGAVSIPGDFIASGAHHAFGISTVVGNVGTRFTHTFTSDGASTFVAGLDIDPTLTGAAGDTDYQTYVNIAGFGITTQASETVSVVSSFRVTDPQITVGSAGTVSVAALAYFDNAPTEGQTNAAIYVNTGVLQIQNGDASNPPYTFKGDTNTGIFSAGADLISFATGGTKRVEISDTSTTFSTAAAAAINLTSAFAGDLGMFIDNTSTNAAAGARLLIRTGGTAASDPWLNFRVTSGSSWSFGIDNSDSDTIKISQSNNVGTNNYFTITTGGVVTLGSGSSATNIAFNTASTTGANTATLTNSPTTGNPNQWIQVTVNGNLRYIPCWA